MIKFSKNFFVVAIIFAMLLALLSGCHQPIAGVTTIKNPNTTFPTKPTIQTTIPNIDDIEKVPVSVSCVAGTPNCYNFDGTTLTFTNVSADSTYVISGTFEGNIVIDTGDNYKFDLEMHGFTIICDYTSPITILSGDEISLKAKKDYENFIYDNRETVDANDNTASPYVIDSEVDLEFSGKGKLEIVSKSNNGVYSKDDIQVKNLDLTVICKDNALKGNDGVEITNANTTLIASAGDCIKTVNSHINANTGNQKGTVYIAGGTHNLYSARDGIDSSYDVVIENSSENTTSVNIYTDRYSPYSEDIVGVIQNNYYIRYNSTQYKFSVLYENSATGETKWVNASDDYKTVTSQGGRPGSSSSKYYYYTVEKPVGFDKLTVYAYSSGQEQSQAENYYACSSKKTVNDSYDTIALSYKNGSFSLSWTNYGTTNYPAGPGGMQEGNSDKGDYSSKGIKSANEVIIKSGSVHIEAYDDGIHANNDGGVLENGANPLGNVTISGGNVTVWSNDDGIHADANLKISAGNVSVLNSYEGLEGTYIMISGGNVSVTSKDDGCNATATTGAAMTVSGGTLYIYAGGDGIDSNSRTSKGAIAFSGGDVVVISTSNGNSAIDSDGGYNHTAGRVLAISPQGAMTNEMTNGNTTGRTTKSSISLSAGGYLVINGAVTVKMPVSMTAYVVYLGSSNANISSANSTSVTLDPNGVSWN